MALVTGASSICPRRWCSALAGVSQAQVGGLVETYKSRCPLYRTVAAATAVKIEVTAGPA